MHDSSPPGRSHLETPHDRGRSRPLGETLEVWTRAFVHLSIRLVGSLLSPPCCVACDALLSREAVFCRSCVATLDPMSTRVVSRGGIRVHAAFAYGGALRTAILRLKHERRSDIAHPLGELLRGVVRRSSCEADLVVPVPADPIRLVERGFFPAGILARCVARELGLRSHPALLERGPRVAQAKLTRAERRRNLVGVVAVRPGLPLQGRRVLLVDDVITTGATIDACGEAIFRAGAARVEAVTVAASLID